MKKRVNEGIRKTQCYEFESFLIKNFYAIQKGRKRTADVVREFLDSIGKTNDKNAFDQLLKYAKKEVLKMQQNSENERFGGDDGNLWENKKVKISETKLKSIIRLDWYYKSKYNYIQIEYDEDLEQIILKSDTMYNNMKLGKEYSLEELGL